MHQHQQMIAPVTFLANNSTTSRANLLDPRPLGPHRPPVVNISETKPSSAITETADSPDPEFWTQAHTCENILELPDYSAALQAQLVAAQQAVQVQGHAARSRPLDLEAELHSLLQQRLSVAVHCGTFDLKGGPSTGQLRSQTSSQTLSQISVYKPCHKSHLRPCHHKIKTICLF